MRELAPDKSGIRELAPEKIRHQGASTSLYPPYPPPLPLCLHFVAVQKTMTSFASVSPLHFREERGVGGGIGFRDQGTGGVKFKDGGRGNNQGSRS